MPILNKDIPQMGERIKKSNHKNAKDNHNQNGQLQRHAKLFHEEAVLSTNL